MKKNNLLCSSWLHLFEDTFVEILHFFEDNALYTVLDSKSTLTKILHPSIKYPTNIAIFAHNKVSKKNFIQRKQTRDFGYIESRKKHGIAAFEVWRNSNKNLNHYSTTNSAPKPGQGPHGHSTWTIGLQSVDTQQPSETASVSKHNRKKLINIWNREIKK